MSFLEDNSNQNRIDLKKINPIEEFIIKLCYRYCGFKTLRLSSLCCIFLLFIYFLYLGAVFNFKSILWELTVEINNLIPFSLICVLIDFSFLYLYLHFIDVLYKSKFNLPIMYISPLIWGLGIFIELIMVISYGDYYEPDNLIKWIIRVAYISIGVLGYNCLKFSKFNWDGKVLMILSCSLFILTFYRNISIPRTIFCELTYLWFWYRIKKSVTSFYRGESLNHKFKIDN